MTAPLDPFKLKVLRHHAGQGWAADTLEALQAENERLRARLTVAERIIKDEARLWSHYEAQVTWPAALDTQTADDGEAAACDAPHGGRGVDPNVASSSSAPPEQDRTHFHVDIVLNDWHNAKQVRVMTASLDGSYRFATEPHAPADCPFAGKGDEVPMQVIPVKPGEPLPAPPARRSAKARLGEVPPRFGLVADLGEPTGQPAPGSAPPGDAGEEGHGA